MTSGSEIALCLGRSAGRSVSQEGAVAGRGGGDRCSPGIEALQPKLNAFCVVDRDGASPRARSEQRWRQGHAAGPARRRAGDDQGPRADARLSDVARLEADRSGAGLVGGRPGGGAAARGRGGDPRQDHDPEFGWKAIGDSPLTGITRNPWNLERIRPAAAAPAPPPPALPVSRRCMSAATAPARSAFLPPSPGSSASRRRSAGCRRYPPPRRSGLLVECRADGPQHVRDAACCC